MIFMILVMWLHEYVVSYRFQKESILIQENENPLTIHLLARKDYMKNINTLIVPWSAFFAQED